MTNGHLINMESFNRGILKLRAQADKDGFIVALEKAAAFLIGRAMDHSPKDTGTLAGSGTWKRSGAAEVTFGFNTEYAAVQNSGSVKLACKGYDSEIGPNLYFSGTLERCASTAMRIIADMVKKQTGAA